MKQIIEEIKTLSESMYVDVSGRWVHLADVQRILAKVNELIGEVEKNSDVDYDTK